ncbi:hypothetical protein F3N42_09825 [Marinihelvus fidelis]|uniref:Uncharacterized protein n=1 Tax=Marinihelvus fidelis TaxID=2613842 RepID=A0A5N0TAZ6_9GAMM|nr:hypothetical protein [Marinihelvus fidelis]KAA9131604.1 hypothetical protein F3N42_09825 [Marinihelvus fidelis]
MDNPLKTLWALLRLKAGPQDLPSSWALTLIVMMASFGASVLTAQHLGNETAAGRSLLAIGIQAIAVLAILRYRRRPERAAQTLLALAAVGIAMGLLLFVLLVQADSNVNQPLLFFVWFFIFCWGLAVDANIYRHALDTSLSIGVLITVLLMAMTYVILHFAYTT